MCMQNYQVVVLHRLHCHYACMGVYVCAYVYVCVCVSVGIAVKNVTNLHRNRHVVR
jgi:hypothetical protein